jgi:hypothetical protein
VVRTGGEDTGDQCHDPTAVPGEHGGFPLRFGLFVATIVLWIPLYFWWATRRRDTARDDQA